MAKIELNSDKFHLSRFKDGIVVSFMKTDNDQSIAYQIHSIVSKNLRNELFASDIVDRIDCPKSEKEIIRNTLFVYSDKGISISGHNIHAIYGKNQLKIQYKKDEVLIISRPNHSYFRLFLLAVFAIIVINVLVPDKCDDVPINTDKQDMPAKQTGKETMSVIGKTDNENINLPSASDPPQEQDMQIVKEELEESNTTQEINGMVNDGHTTDYISETSPIMTDASHLETNHEEPKSKNHSARIISKPQSSEVMTGNDITDKRNAAKEYLRIAKEAYKRYSISLDVSDGIEALNNYEKALTLSEYLPNDIESIIEHINTLKEVIN